jgi:hypothetical protein
MKTDIRKIVWCLLMLALVQSACRPQVAPTPAATLPVPPAPPANSTPSAQVYPQPFAPYREVAAKIPQAFQGGGYNLPVDLGKVQGLNMVDLTDAERSLLAQNGFVVAVPQPREYNEFYQIYEQRRYDEMPVFVTTDSIYHIYHLIFDKMLRDLETDYFIADLRSLTTGMLAAATAQYDSLKGTSLQDPALRNVAYFAVADRLLGLSDPVPSEANDLVNAELALINAASSPDYSPIWDRPDLPAEMKLIEDYTQYIPRGHYTRSEDLKMYFKAMMWYGRMTFRQTDDFETRRALLLVQALRQAKAADGTSAGTLWQLIYDPTVFIIGKSDDLGYIEYGALSDRIFGADPDPGKFADPVQFANFQQAAKTLPPPQVNSMWVWIKQDKEQVTRGFRFMGQRFTLDEYVFGQVIWRNVGTLDKPRGLPKGLDFFAAMGSDEAYDILKGMGETEYANYDAQMEKVKGQVAGLESDSWTQNLYWSWLHSLRSIIAPKGSAYPPFMQTQAWTRKDLQTALGSWTELKHDTILYSKQVMAEMGGGPSPTPPPPPHGYVEPNPQAYARLLALAQMTEDGLQSRSLLSDLTRGNLENLISELEFLKDISERELSGGSITDDEYWEIVYWGGTLEHFTMAAADTTGGEGRKMLEADQKAALVADVATGTDASGSLVALEEAVGQPTPIYVVLPDSPWRVAVGAVYSYYEFNVPVSGRLTDEAWQKQIAGGTNPAQPDWVKLFAAPAPPPALIDAGVNASLPTFEQLASLPDLFPKPSPYKALMSPGQNRYQLTVRSNQSYYLGFTWCTVTQEQLDSNLKAMSYRLIIQSQEVSPANILQYEGPVTNGGKSFKCHYWTTILSDWQPGARIGIGAFFEHSEPLFDGMTSYPPGRYEQWIDVTVQ